MSSPDKVARLAALVYASERGWLKGRSLEEIARVLAGEGEEPVNRSTILRTLRDVEPARELRDRMIERLRSLAQDELTEFVE